MSEVAVKKSVCDACGASVREGSTFCYSCGKPVPAEKKTETVTESPTVSKNGLPADSFDAPIVTEGPLAEDKPKMRSAASMRRGVKAYNRKPVEVVWVEREGPGSFLIVSIVLVILTSILLALALYLK